MDHPWVWAAAVVALVLGYMLIRRLGGPCCAACAAAKVVEPASASCAASEYVT